MKKTKKSVVPAVNDKMVVVAPSPESYQKRLRLKEQSGVVDILRQRLTSRSCKKGRPAEDFFNGFFARNNIAIED